MLLGVTLLKNRGPDLIGELTGRFEGVGILIVTDTSDEVSAFERGKTSLPWHGDHTADVGGGEKANTILGHGKAAPTIQLSVMKWDS
ncbi:hypothetical protein [Bradyrhizobium sp. CCGUVB1N3]|uniref:hypothetical protein n=1 Tax=Bradyrhizobium sp. CCGUVB1N3 TaxID=2949629 RepID=UPI0035323C0B